jgi:hypothetical protein
MMLYDAYLYYCLNSRIEISMQTSSLIQQAVKRSCLLHSGCRATMHLFHVLAWTLPRDLQGKSLFR